MSPDSPSAGLGDPAENNASETQLLASTMAEQPAEVPPSPPSGATSDSPTIVPQQPKVVDPSQSIDLTGDSDEEEAAANAPANSGDGRENLSSGGGGAQALGANGPQAVPEIPGSVAAAPTPPKGTKKFEFRSWQPAQDVKPGSPYRNGGGAGQPPPHGYPGTTPTAPQRPPPGYTNGVGINGAGHKTHPPGGYGPPPPYSPYGGGPPFPPSAGFTSQIPPPLPPRASGPLSYIPLGAAGGSLSSAIDLTNLRVPSPPPLQDPKAPMCVGALVSRAIMLYPQEAALIGAQPRPGTKERFEIRQWRGAEFLKVKLKLRQAGTEPRADAPGTSTDRDMIQVTTPSLITYLGDLDPTLGDVLAPHMKRGLLRLEGFVQRLHPDAPQFEIRVNVLLFTLPSNVRYISNALLNSAFFLTDPLPPYEADRHADNPPYRNAHMADEETRRHINMYVARLSGLDGRYGNFGGLPGLASGQMDKAKQVEVQRQQVDLVFKSLDKDIELAQSDPGPWIKTELFPHQRRALTFLLEREGDSSMLKKCRKYHDKKEDKKARKRNAAKKGTAESVGGSTNGDGEKPKEEEKDEADGKKVKKEKGKEKLDKGRTLWEPIPDESGKVRVWRNRITEEKRRSKEQPDEGKGAILADDMGLGKTLSIVSLIAATRESAYKWARSKSADSDVEMEEVKPDISASGFKNRVFGMPDVDLDNDVKPSVKKRKRDEADEKNAAARQARIKIRARGNLLVCPMSTITNWEDQIKEHWNGVVEIVGGSGVAPKDVVPRQQMTLNRNGGLTDEDDDDVLRVYVYHGSAKIGNPEFLADFDIVITSYNTLALEFSKMSALASDDPTPAETAENSEDEAVPVLGDTSLGARATKPEVEAEIKAAEVADRLRKAESKKKGKGTVKKPEISALQAVEWFRIVLDEAHYIKTAATVASKAACYLAADRRIALTGTPIQNKIEDIWALFKFLRLDPVDQKEVFNEFIWNPCKQGNSVGVAKLQLVMRCCTLRRTKDSVAEDGRRILNLPARKEMQLWLDLRADEREVYDQKASALREKVAGLRVTGELGKNYANVLQEVLRLRQICNHVDLAMLGAVEEDYDGTVMDYQVAVQGIERNGLTLPRAQSVVSFRKDGDGAQCDSCGLDYNDSFPSMGLGGVEEEVTKKALKKLTHRPLLTKCLHMFCAKCFKSGIYGDYKPKMRNSVNRPCNACGAPLKLPTDVIEVVPPGSEQAAELAEQAPKRAVRKKYVRQPGEKPNLSTKMQFLLDDLMKYSRRNPNSVNYNPMMLGEDDEDGVEELDAEGKPFITKSIVFSQWTTMLDRIGDMLEEANIKYDRLDGTMTREDRARAMQALKNNKKIEVLIVSTRAGGVGLNLTTASRAYLVDPYWNPSVEAQAIDRIHRMGQTRPVTAIKLMIKDSIEMKLDEIQKKKANLANLSLKPMTRKELMEQKAEELASLFR